MVLRVQMATELSSVSAARTVSVCYMVLQMQMATECSSVSTARTVSVCYTVLHGVTGADGCRTEQCVCS